MSQGIYIDGSNEMNDINQGQKRSNKPEEKPIRSGLYYVIPSQVFEDDRLEHSETVFYALLSGIAWNDGYCYASNDYLAKRMKVDERTIRKWLERLENFGYIHRETSKKGMFWERKIFISHSVPVSKDVYERNRGAASKGPGRPDEEELEGRKVSEVNIVSKDTYIPPTPKGESVSPEVVIYGKYVKLSKGEFDALRELCGSTNVLSELINEINDYISSHGKKPYKDYAATIRNWWRRKQSQQRNSAPASQERVETAQKFAKRVEGRFPHHPDIRVEKNGIEFVLGVGGSKMIPYTENGFEDQVRNRLQLMNLPIGDL